MLLFLCQVDHKMSKKDQEGKWDRVYSTLRDRTNNKRKKPVLERKEFQIFWMKLTWELDWKDWKVFMSPDPCCWCLNRLVIRKVSAQLGERWRHLRRQSKTRRSYVCVCTQRFQDCLVADGNWKTAIMKWRNRKRGTKVRMWGKVGIFSELIRSMGWRRLAIKSWKSRRWKAKNCVAKKFAKTKPLCRSERPRSTASHFHLNQNKVQSIPKWMIQELIGSQLIL